MSTESKDFDHYAIVLADLRAKKQQIEQAIQAIEALRGNAAGSVPNQPVQSSETSPSQGDFLGMSISEATKKLLKSRRTKMSNSEILAALQAGGLVMTASDPLNTVGAVITRRSKEVGDIVKVGRGIWGLKEWYPGRNFSRNSKAAGEVESSSSLESFQIISEPDDDEFL